MPDIVLVRHGETEWTVSGQHTSITDVELTDGGRRAAVAVGRVLSAWDFAAVLTSPRRRARETCELTGLGDRARVVAELEEWNYGKYEGRTTPEIRDEQPGWSLWRDGAPGGEAAAEVAARADRLLQELRELLDRGGDAVVFSHGHFLRVFAARWLDLAPEDGRLLGPLAPAGLGVLGRERENAVVSVWNRLAAEGS
ncbi:MAG TPA: histidine phosphatase family protein [Acidimicrobiales bacterium]|nr:histidine phosphatase family protein [Acidimicrobiales bacterium]